MLQDVLKTLGEVPADSNTAVPKKTIRILDCGVNGLQKKYDLTAEQIDSEEDVSED